MCWFGRWCKPRERSGRWDDIAEALNLTAKQARAHYSATIDRGAWTDDGPNRDTRGLSTALAERAGWFHVCLRCCIGISPTMAQVLMAGPFVENGPRGSCRRSQLGAQGQGAMGDLHARGVHDGLARTPYDLRHAAVSTWLNGGVPPTTVAE